VKKLADCMSTSKGLTNFSPLHPDLQMQVIYHQLLCSQPEHWACTLYILCNVPAVALALQAVYLQLLPCRFEQPSECGSQTGFCN